MTTTPFRLHAALTAWEKAGDDRPMRIGGVVSTASLDADDERLVQAGLDFDPFLASGWYNDNHGQKTADVVGYPEGARLVKKGDRLPNGKIAEQQGWWAEGYLLNTDEGRKLWSLAQALEQAPRKLGFSIEGRVLERDPRDPKTVRRAVVRNVAITHCPKNTDTELVTLAKALTAGSAVADPGASPGDGFALRTESVDRALRRPVRDDVPEVLEVDLDADGAELDADAVKATVDRDFPMEYTDDAALLEDWSGSLPHAVRTAANRTVRLTKAEATIYLAAQRPSLAAHQIDRILANARSPR